MQLLIAHLLTNLILTEDLLILGLIMAAQPPPYPTDPSAAYPPQTGAKPVDAYGQPVAAGAYQPPAVDAYGQPIIQQQAATTVSS